MFNICVIWIFTSARKKKRKKKSKQICESQFKLQTSHFFLCCSGMLELNLFNCKVSWFVGREILPQALRMAFSAHHIY